MIEALLALALAAQGTEDWQDDEEGDRAILALTAWDMEVGRRTTFRISEVEVQGRRTLFVQRRIVQRQGGSSHQLTGIGCPAFAPLLDRAAAMLLPSPGLVRIGPITSDARADATLYRLEGIGAWPDGRRVPVRIESVEEQGAEPSQLGRWGQSLMRAFQACLGQDFSDARPDGDEGPGCLDSAPPDRRQGSC